ncbi:MAG: hypothetical protein N2203_02725 [Bacteroidia bacterium]|nr:hypothetical protein [Bacteroidia bacterium]
MLLFNFLMMPIESQNQKLISIRQEFELYKDNPSKCLYYINELEKTNIPEIQGYRAMFSFMMANHSFDPFSKWHYFLKGKKILEEQINKNKQNIELRFLRFVIQTNIPSILGYYQSTNEDKSILLDALKNNKISDEDLKNRMIKILKQNKNLSESEKNIL